MLTVLTTALLSGLFSGLTLFALNERKERSGFQLAKIEELLSAYAEWTDSIMDFYGRVFTFAEIPLPEGWQADNGKIQLELKAKYTRVRTLYYLYADRDNNPLIAANEATRPMIQTWSEASLANIAKDSSKALEIGKSMTPHLLAFVEVQSRGINQLISQGRRVATQPLLMDRAWPRGGFKPKPTPNPGKPSALRRWRLGRKP